VTFKQIAKAVYSDMRTLPVEAREELEPATLTIPSTDDACATHLAVVELIPRPVL